MKKSLKTAVLGLVAAFALAACGDTAQEARERPSLTEDIIADSVAVCEMGPVNADESSYTARLTEVLGNTNVPTLRALLNNAVTVCLDQRLINEKIDPVFGREILGTYYRDDNIVTIWDSGKNPGEAGFLERHVSTYGDQLLETLGDRLRDKGFVAEQFMYAASYYCGKACNRIEWRNSRDFHQDSVRDNPFVNTPPLRGLNS